MTWIGVMVIRISGKYREGGGRLRKKWGTAVRLEGEGVERIASERCTKDGDDALRRRDDAFWQHTVWTAAPSYRGGAIGMIKGRRSAAIKQIEQKSFELRAGPQRWHQLCRGEV